MSRILSTRRAGFTWIELGIVIVIFAILAALIIPELMERPVNGLVSRTKARMRALSTELEAYRVDCGAYPAPVPLRVACRNPRGLRKARGWDLMGVGGIKGEFTDPITENEGLLGLGHRPPWDFAYYAAPDNRGGLLWSPGLDGDYDIQDAASIYGLEAGRGQRMASLTYDPTNGTLSDGDVMREFYRVPD